MKSFRIALFTFLLLTSILASPMLVLINPVAANNELEIVVRPMFQVEPMADPLAVSGYSPTQIRAAYNLPSSGGTGTIAIIDAYDAPSMLSDLTYFSNYFGLPAPTSSNYEEHHMYTPLSLDDGWAMETALDVEWAHAIAPNAKILLVQARSDTLNDLLAAVDYARSRSDVVSVSMSWGADEFSNELSYDFHFTSSYNAVFFAASGDDGSGVIWPSSSVNVVSVGGTTLNLDTNGFVISETGWSGSGGGVSSYEAKPAFQTDYGVPANRRAVPDVSYNANPNTGFAVYISGAWWQVGGTSAGTPQWAAIHALGGSAYNTNLYQAATSDYSTYFRDITIGSNGAYSANVGYDYVTGLGSPLTTSFETSATTNTTITLLPAGQSTPLSSSNQFTISYTFEGTPQTAFAQNGTLTLATDSHTNLQIAGTSTGSTANEEWVFTSTASPVIVSSGTTTSLYYYNRLTQTSTYSVVGDGNPPSPTVKYYTAPSSASSQGTQQTATLTLSPVTPQAIRPTRGTSVSVTNPLMAGSTEQWTTPTAVWTITDANQMPSQIVYTHQFLLSIAGAPVSSQWYNVDDTANVSIPGVFSRALGTGQRTTAYSLDGGPTPVAPSTSDLTIQVLMDAPHQLQVSSTRQYQVVLDTSVVALIDLITPPTISGDNYWYDENTAVTLTLNGVANRAAGIGNRLASYSVNSVQTNVTTTGTVEVLNIGAITSSQTVSATPAVQYQLSMPSGSVNSVTSPTILGDAGWYDSGTEITATFNYTWNASNNTRTNALNFIINSGPTTTLSRSSIGTFPVQTTMTETKTVNIASTMQYLFSLSGGNNVTLSQSSPTADSYFDSGTSLTLTADSTWDLANGNTRKSLTSYTLDGTTTNVTAVEGTPFILPILFNSTHQLTLNTGTQHLAIFQFKDNNGTVTITPTSFKITSNSLGLINVPTFRSWLSSGTQFQVSSVIWQNAEVKPTNQATYVANAPLNVTVLCSVFNAKLVVQDRLGAPVSGAQVTVTLANQTVIEAVTGADGAVNMSLIPQGTFNATITYLGTTTTVSGDASSQPVTVKVISTEPSPSPSPSPSPFSSPSPSPTPTASTPTPSPTESPNTTPNTSPNPTASATPTIPEFTAPTIIIGLLVLATALALAFKKKQFATRL